MDRETVNSRQFILMMALFILGNVIATDVNRSAGKDTWLVILSAMAAAVPAILMYARISSLYPDCNIFSILYKLFGRAAGCVLSIVLVLYFLVLSVAALRGFGVYTAAVVFHKTPVAISAVPLALICAWAVSRGKQVMARMGVLLFWLVAASLVFTTVLSIRYLKLENLLPIMYRPAEDVFMAGLPTLAVPFCESVVLLGLSGNLKQGQNKYTAYLRGLLLGGFTLALISLRSILMLGEYPYTALYFPSYTAVSMINIGQYLQRIESLVSINLLFCVFIKFSVCIYAASAGIRHVFSMKKYTWLIYALSLAATVTALLLTSGDAGDILLTDSGSYHIYSLPVQIALPALIWIAAEIRRKKRKPS